MIEVHCGKDSCLVQKKITYINNDVVFFSFKSVNSHRPLASKCVSSWERKVAWDIFIGKNIERQLVLSALQCFGEKRIF